MVRAEEKGKNRLIIIPKKSLPTKPGKTEWGFVDLVEDSMHDVVQEGLEPAHYRTPKGHVEKYVFLCA